MKILRARRALGALLVLSAVAAACGDDDGDGDAAAAATSAAAATAPSTSGDEGASETSAGEDDAFCTEERRGGTLTVGVGGPFTSTDPTVVLGSGGAGGDYMSAFYDTLLRYDPESGTFEPNVAESLTPNADQTRWTLKLRPGVTFGNGDPLTTEHVKFNIERLAQARVGGASKAQLIESMTIVDDLTMELTLKEPFGMFPIVFATEPGWIANMNVVTSQGERFGTDPTGAGVGPFEFARFAEGEVVELTAKDDWWGGPVCVETLRFMFVASDRGRYEAFQAGELQTAFIDDVVIAGEADEEGVLVHRLSVGSNPYIVTDQGISGRATPFQDVRVREAMQLAIDYGTLDARLYDGMSASSSAIVAASSALSPGIEGPPYDLDRARQLVEATKAEGVWDGSFTLLHGSTSADTDLAVLLEGMWEAAGMSVEIEAAPNVAQRIIFDRNFQAAPLGFALREPAPWTLLNGLRTGSPRQRAGFSDPDMDAAIDALRAATTLEEARAALGDVQEVWNRTFPLISVAHSVWAIAAADDVHGLQFGADATPIFSRVWLG